MGKRTAIGDQILAMYAPEITPEFIALHERIENAHGAKNAELFADLLQQCTEPECIVCGGIACPHGEPLHFHHDGCPACDGGRHGK